MYPNMYLYNAYGLACLQHRIWTMEKSAMEKEQLPDPYHVEVMAMLERAMAYMFTGDARVIVKSLMGPYGLKHSLVELGLPAITLDIAFDEQLATPIALKRANWPLVGRQEPAVASRRSQLLNYGEDHCKVSFNHISYIPGNRTSSISRSTRL